MGVAARLAKRAVALGLAVLGLTIAAVVFVSDRNLETHGQGRTIESPVDAIVVLGGGLWKPGSLNGSSQRRVETAVDLLKRGKTHKLILSGGGTIGTEPARNAELMRAYAIELGAEADSLIIEPRSVSTFENLRFSFALAESRGLEHLGILTDAFHLERARHLAGYLGRADVELVAVAGADQLRYEIYTQNIVREALAWWFNLGKVVAWEALGAAGVPVETRGEWIR